MDHMTFVEWTKNSKHGDSVVYFAGTAVYDRTSGLRNRIGGIAYDAYERGVVSLVQKRASPSPGMFLYIAQRL